MAGMAAYRLTELIGTKYPTVAGADRVIDAIVQDVIEAVMEELKKEAMNGANENPDRRARD